MKKNIMIYNFIKYFLGSFYLPLYQVDMAVRKCLVIVAKKLKAFYIIQN